MKTNTEILQYQDLRIRMELKFANSETTWSNHYAALLEFGGKNPSQQLRNIFLDDSKKFTDHQLSLIYTDLNNYGHLDSFTQDELKTDVLEFVSKIGDLSTTLKQVFDNDDEISLEEITKLLPYIKKIDSMSHTMLFRALQTKEDSQY